jgi:predicted flap endonuclease-1-like 5' DNA nuclease
MGDLAVVPQEQPQPPQPPTPQPVRAVPLPAPIPQVRPVAQPTTKAAVALQEPIPQVRPVAQPTTKAAVALQEEPPADDLAEIAGITPDTAGILALVGIRTFKNLATLTGDGIGRVTQLTGKGEGHVRSWIEGAKERLAGEGDDDSGSGDGDSGDLGADLPDDV